MAQGRCVFSIGGSLKDEHMGGWKLNSFLFEPKASKVYLNLYYINTI